MYRRLVGDAELLLEHDQKRKFHPIGCDTVKSVFDHEYGHQLDHLLGLRTNPDVVALRAELQKKDNEQHAAWRKEGLTELEARNNMRNYGSAVTNELSRYAEENMADFIAEAWAEANNNPDPRPTAKRLAEIVRAEYAKKYPK